MHAVTCLSLIALLASFVVWGEKERLQLNESPDKVILFIHVSKSLCYDNTVAMADLPAGHFHPSARISERCCVRLVP